MTFERYIEKDLYKLDSKEEKIKYLEKIISDSWVGISFEFQSNAMGMREEAQFQLEKLKQI